MGRQAIEYRYRRATPDDEKWPGTGLILADGVAFTVAPGWMVGHSYKGCHALDGRFGPLFLPDAPASRQAEPVWLSQAGVPPAARRAAARRARFAP